MRVQEIADRCRQIAISSVAMLWAKVIGFLIDIG
jgi:hypothetical protein